MSDTFRCDNCGGVFAKGWTDEVAEQELAQNFPGFTAADCGVVCDDCYKNPQAAWAHHVPRETP